MGGIEVGTLHTFFGVISPTYEEEACLMEIQEYI